MDLLIGFRTAIRAVGGPPKVLVKKSMSLWLLLFGFGLVLGAPVLIDQATIRTRKDTTNGLFDPVIDVWKPVVLPIAGHPVGQEGVAGAAAPSTSTRGAAPALPVPSATASTAAKTASAVRMPSLCRRAYARGSPIEFIQHSFL